jgi:PKHD-type hydroxylase
MIHHLKNVLTATEVTHLLQLAEAANFVDGRITNPNSRVKNNLQIAQNDPDSSEPGVLVRDALFRHQGMRAFAFPRLMARPTLSRYEPGMTYGWHVDEALFPAQPPVRSDISCTVFVSDPATYDGGELVIQLGQQAAGFKLAAGDAVLYPSTTIHQVTPVTRGVRVVAITWIQSYIPDPFQRDLLVQADEAHSIELSRPGGGDPRQTLLLGSLRSNLFRLWSDA